VISCGLPFSPVRAKGCGHHSGFARENFENSGIDLDQMMVRILRTSTAEALEGAATIVVGFVIVRMIRMAPR